jgi:membrane dipeptidase
MSRKAKRYDGYKPYDYLSKEDFEQFEFGDPLNWEGMTPYEIPLSKEETRRLEKIVADNVVISMHDHLVSMAKDLDRLAAALKDGRARTPYEALSSSCLDAVVDNQGMYFLIGQEKKGWKWNDCIYDFALRMADIDHQDLLIRCTCIADIFKAKQNGQIAFIPSFESCMMIENELDRLDILFGLGVRMLGMTYNDANTLGSGLGEKKDRGLTNLGYKAVERMNKLGITIDIAHSGDQTSLDVIEASAKPVVISHAGARGVWNSNRMKSDEVLKACARKCGVLGIEAAPHTTMSDKNPPEQSIESFFEHFKYAVDLMGIDHVGFGPDCCYGDHNGLHHVFSKGLSMTSFLKRGTTQMPHVDYVKGLENPTEAFNNIVRFLVKDGYSDEDIAKVVGGNIFRVLKETWPK